MLEKNRYHYDGEYIVDNAPDTEHDLKALGALLCKLHAMGKSVDEIIAILVVSLGMKPDVARAIVAKALGDYSVVQVQDPFAAYADEPQKDDLPGLD